MDAKPALVGAKLIVADAGPLIALAVGGVLAVSLEMLGGLYVPQAVLHECTADPTAPGATVVSDMLSQGLLHMVPHSALVLLDSALAQGLGTGEIAVLSYAAGHRLLALIDERRARRVARHLKVALIGSGTIVARLLRQNLITSIEPVFAAWQKHGYFVSDQVKADIILLCTPPAN